MGFYRAAYATGVQAGDCGAIFMFAEHWGEARELARAYLEEEHLWDRCGYRNLDLQVWTNNIPVGATLLLND